MGALRHTSAIVLALLAGACGTYALDMEGAPKVPPDERQRTGHEAGEDYYIWWCYEGSRVVIHQHTSFWSRSSPVLERGPCTTPPPPAGSARPTAPDGGT